MERKGGEMATKREAEKRIPNYPNLFGDLEETTVKKSPKTSKTPRRGHKTFKVGSWKGKDTKSQQKQNKRLWETLYPSPARKMR